MSLDTNCRWSPLCLPVYATALALGAAQTAWAEEQSQVVEPPARDTVVVDGVRTESPTLGRLLAPVLDTPQSISSLSREDLIARGSSNLNDALRNIPGISLGAGETSFQGNSANLRGFTTRNDQFLDNIRDYGYYFRDTFNDEKIEVFKGPSSILFGRGSTGGVIHRVSKAPYAENAFDLELTAGLDDTRRAAADINIADVLGAGSALRLNAMAHRSEVAARDGALSQRWGVAPTVALGMGGDTRFTLSYIHQEEDNRPDYGIPWLPGNLASPGFPAPVARANYYGFENDFLDTNVNIATARFEHDLNAQLTIRSQTRYSNNSRRFRYGEAIIAPGTPQDTPLDTINVSRNLFEGSSIDRFAQNQTDLIARFSLGGTAHQLIAGVEVGTERAQPVYITNLLVPGTSLTQPEGPEYTSANQFVRLRADSRAETIGLYAIDTIEYGEQLRAIVGIRWDSFRADYDSIGFNPDGSVNAETVVDRVDHAFSYRGALVFKPTPAASFYGSYGTSFNPSGEGIESFISAGRSVAQSNINLDPETSRSGEIGAKFELFDSAGLLTLSLFRTEKNNVRVPDPATPGFNTLGGSQRVDGFEVEFSGSPIPPWRLLFGYTLLDSKTTASSPGGPLVGEPLLIAPRHMGAISSWYDFTDRLSAGAALVATSERVGQNTPASYLVAPGFVLVDLSSRFQVSRNVELRVNVNNLFNELYYDQLHPVHVIPGAGRTALARVTISL